MLEAELGALRDQIRSMGPIIMAARPEIDRIGRLPETVVAEFEKNDVNRLFLPKDLNGRGIDPVTLFELVAEVAYFDASAGWNFAVVTNGALVGGGLDTEVTREIFATPNAAIAGSAAPQGRAKAVEGGYEVTGTFAWASGVYQSSWILGGCFVYDGDERRIGGDGAPVIVQVLIPKQQAALLDTWNVGGLRGTGSTEVRVEDVFVPEKYVLKLYSDGPNHPSPIYRLPPTFFGLCISGVPIGQARYVIDGLKDLARRKTPPAPRSGLADQASTQYTVAKAEAMTSAAFLGVRAAAAELWRQICEEGEASMESRASLRAAMVHSTETCIEAVQLCYRIAGGSALFDDEPFERALRDVNAAGGHLTLQQAAMEDAGRVMLGLKPLLAVF